jgi:hypothetical protein
LQRPVRAGWEILPGVRAASRPRAERRIWRLAPRWTGW